MSTVPESPAEFRLVVISPCRNEADFLEDTIRSVVAQTRRPDRWIIVDDGSTDDSARIAQGWARRHPWIEVVRRPANARREMGPKIVAAFNAGLAHLDDRRYDVISKMDCDVSFEPDAFSRILALFEDPDVGMASGVTRVEVGGRFVSERYPPYHVTGAAKFYRRACFIEIGGLPELHSWDMLDEAEARRHGWKTVTDPTVAVLHHRIQGGAIGLLRGRIVWGYGAYAIGSHPLFALARGVYRMPERPWVVGGFLLIAGFFLGYLNPRVTRNPDEESVRYLRREQLYRLFHGNRLPPGTARSPAVNSEDGA